MNFPLRRGVGVVLMDFIMQKARLPPMEKSCILCFLGLIPSSLGLLIRECKSVLCTGVKCQRRWKLLFYPAEMGKNSSKDAFYFKK